MKSRWLSLGCFVFLLGLTWAGARAGDVPVSINDELKGAWLQPAKDWDGPTVLLLHGLADDMDGAGDLTKRLANELAAHGIASLRINFRGEGDRRRTDIRSTLATRIADAEAAYAFAVKQPGAKAERCGVEGWSLGGSTAIEVAARHPAWFRSMVLWSGPWGDQDKFVVGTPEGQRALKEGSVTEDIAGWKKMTLHRDYFESFRGVDLDRSLAKYPGAFLSVRGSLDFIPPHENEFMQIVKGHPAEAVLIGGASHIFDVFDPATGHADRAVNVTVEFLQRTL